LSGVTTPADLETSWRDGTTHLVIGPLELMQRLPRWFRDPGCT
jgi:hypothetical protein